jgi:O-antigen/teichoic acid export membrane protein
MSSRKNRASRGPVQESHAEAAAGDASPANTASADPIATLAESAAATESPDPLSSSRAGPAAVRGGAFRVGGFILGALVSVISAALLFRYLGVVDVGRYVTALSLVAIVGALSDLGLTAVGVRETSIRPAGERWQVARELLGLRITLTILGGIVITAIAAVAYSGTLAAGVALASVGLLLQAMQDNFALPLIVGLRLGWVAALDLLRQVLTTMFIVVLVVAAAPFLSFLAISIPVGAVVLLITARLVWRTRSLTPVFSWSRWRALLAAMLPYAVAVATSALYFRVSIILVSVVSDPTQLGYFAASFRIIEVLAPVPALVVGSALPIFARAARDDHDRLGYSLGKVYEVSVIVGAWVAVSIAVGAPLAISIVGGAKFHPAVPVLAIQGVGLGVMFVSAVWANGLLSLGLYRQILLINAAALLFNALLVTALVELDGARGAAIGTAIAETVAAILLAAAVIRGRPRLRPSMRVLPRVALAAALGLVPLAMTGIPVVVRLAISTALFGATLLISRALPPELEALIPDSLSRLKLAGR